jgi:hypothetical protein
MQKKKPKSYEEIRAIWYKKLEKSGFKDIEQDEDDLKVWSTLFTRKRTKELKESREAYYYMAQSFLNDYKFANNIERVIWEYHTGGIGIRDIVKTLSKAGVQNCKRNKTWTIINRLRNSMKKMYMTGPSHSE